MTYSKVALFRRCRRQFWLRYVSGVDPQPADPMTVGGIIGTGVHRALRSLAETDDPAAGAARLETYLRMPEHDVCAEGTEGYRTAFRLYEAGCDAHAAISSEDTWAEKSTYRLAPAHGISVYSQIDRVDKLGKDAWQIIDWKTGYREDDDETDSQLDLAHVAFRTSYPHVPAGVAINAVAWNLRTGRQRPRTLLASDVEPVLREYGALARRMQATTEFGPSPGRHCSICPWRERCPEGQEATDGAQAAPQNWPGADDQD
jgi:putative RecB family exonuclease